MKNNGEVKSMKKRYELLAPAGNSEALRAAVQNRADAVYLSGKAFGARKFAGNFTKEELVKAVQYCHVRGVAVYVTVNTLVFNDEMDTLKAYLAFLYNHDVDAIIVQDIGVLDYIRKTYPDWDVHCSTQMSVQTMADVHYLEKLGVQRVVLGREMSLETIRQVKKKTNLALEVFVHGALCISVSGQCLMSSMIGGRSGNRGRCAQPCRQLYTLTTEKTRKPVDSFKDRYLLSPKDLCTLKELHHLVDAGAFSFKIEGRMKSPEYVAAVVRAYRNMLDAIEAGKKVREEAKEKELAVFNRGFTRGHLFGDEGARLMSSYHSGNQGYLLGSVIGYDKKKQQLSLKLEETLSQNDEIQIRRDGKSFGGRAERIEQNGKMVTYCAAGAICKVNFKHECYSKEQVFKTYDEIGIKSLKETYHKEMLEIPVKIEVSIKDGEALYGKISDGSQEIEVWAEDVPERALNKPLSEEKAMLQMSKLGGTPFKAQEMIVHLGSGLAVPIKALNELRRDLVEALIQERSKWHQRQKGSAKSLIEVNQIQKNDSERKWSKKELKFSCSVTSLEQLEALLLVDSGSEIPIIYFRNPDLLEDAIKVVAKHRFKGKLVPEILKLVSDEELIQYRQKIQALGLDTVLIQNVGHIEVFKSFEIMGDISLNIVNDRSLCYYYQHHMLQRVALSPEVNLSQIKEMDLIPSKTELLGFGFLPVMALKHCLVKGNNECRSKSIPCRNELCRDELFFLKDRKSEHFPIYRHATGYSEVYNSKRLLLLENMQDLAEAGIGIMRLNFLHEEKQETMEIAQMYINAQKGTCNKVDKKRLEALKNEGITRGHLFRGAE